MWRKILTRTLALAGVIAPALALCAEPETVTGPEASGAAPVVVPVETIAKLLEITRKLEGENGPYDSELGEQLSGLGLAYQQNGEHAQAAETLGRALQIKRVNDGLQDMGQLPILQEIMESNIATKNWEDLDRNYQLLLWLHRRNFEVGDPRFLPIVDQMGRWKLQAYREDLLKQEGVVTLREADELFHDTVELLEDKYGESDPRLVESLYGKAVANYAVMALEASKPLSEHRGRPNFPRYSYRQVCQQVRTPAGPRTVCQTIAIPTMDISSFQDRQQEKDFTVHRRLLAAKSTLQQIVDIHEAHPELSRESHARALMHLGDWHTLNNRLTTATDLYRRAYHMLVEAGTGAEDMKKLFGSPVSVPTLRLPLPDVEKKLTEERQYVNVAFDVTKTGRVSNVEVLDGAEDKPAKRNAIRKLIIQNKFRPRMENGEPVDTTGVKMRVPLST